MRRSLAFLLCACLLSAPWAMAEEPVPPAPAEEPELSDPEAQFWRGFNLLYGRGVPVDLAESTLWFRRSAEQGYLRSQVHLGMAYLKGRGVEPDPREAHKWLELAAEQGHPKAQLETGLAYWQGRGVRRDRIEALKWMMLARRTGGPMVTTRVPQFLAAASGEERKAARARADEWLVAQGVPVAPRAPAAEEPTDS